MRRGDWMQTYSGKQFWPLDPHADEVDIGDIAHSLSLQCRFAGHCREFYSVAQHSVLVSLEAEEATHKAEETPNRVADPARVRLAALWGLLHDASEAYLIDVPRPIKPHLAGYRGIEVRVQDVICEHFGLPLDPPAVVHVADGVLLATEARDLMGRQPAPWAPMPPPRGNRIEPWPPGHAKSMFLKRFADLTQ